MTSRYAGKKAPSQRRIGCRIRVKPENAEEAARLFELRGFTPIYVDFREDGDISIWFGKATDDVLHRIASCIPNEFFAIQGVVVGDSYPFSSDP